MFGKNCERFAECHKSGGTGENGVDRVKDVSQANDSTDGDGTDQVATQSAEDKAKDILKKGYINLPLTIVFCFLCFALVAGYAWLNYCIGKGKVLYSSVLPWAQFATAMSAAISAVSDWIIRDRNNAIEVNALAGEEKVLKKTNRYKIVLAICELARAFFILVALIAALIVLR